MFQRLAIVGFEHSRVGWGRFCLCSLLVALQRLMAFVFQIVGVPGKQWKVHLSQQVLWAEPKRGWVQTGVTSVFA